MARRRQPAPTTTGSTAAKPTATPADLRERILADFAALKVPLRAEEFDAALAEAARDGLSHQQFLHRLIALQADRRRERRRGPVAAGIRPGRAGRPAARTGERRVCSPLRGRLRYPPSSGDCIMPTAP